MELKTYLHERAALVDGALHGLMTEKSLYPEVIHEAMHYSLFAGGKRLRPILCLAGAEALSKGIEPLLPVACALEMIHTYSLIHDDLPVMDNDDYRRGKLTNHKVYGEAIALLAGDALLTYAFEILGEYGLQQNNYRQTLQVIKEIAQAAGTMGMIGGQVVDIRSEGQSIDRMTLEYIHTHKTGALFRASLRAGAILSNAQPEEVTALTKYAEHFGLAFQITDDLLDVIGDSQKLGKPVGSDEKNNKKTYPVLYGLEHTRMLAKEAVEKAVESLKDLPGNTEPLEMLAQFLLVRES